MYLYTYILFNLNTLPSDYLESLLGELNLTCLAKFIKDKFKDKRSVQQIVNLIKEEYCLSVEQDFTQLA